MDSKLLFLCNLYYFGAFGTIWLPYKTRCGTGRTGAKLHATKSHRNFSQQTHPIHPMSLTSCFGVFRTIWVHSEPFGGLTKFGAKRAELVQKFMPRSRIGIFRNQRTRSTPLDPKLTFGAFRTIWVHSGPFGCLTKLGAKLAELVQKFVPRSLLALLKYQFYPLFNFDNGMNLISKSLTILTSARLLVVFAFAHIFRRYFFFAGF